MERMARDHIAANAGCNGISSRRRDEKFHRGDAQMIVLRTSARRSTYWATSGRIVSK
jgi:hypothetical protein